MVAAATASTADFLCINTHHIADVSGATVWAAVSNNSDATRTGATVIRRTKFRWQIEFQHRNPHLESWYLRQYDTGASRRMELIIWTIDCIGALQMIQTCGVWRQRMPWTFQISMSSATNPEFAQLFIFRVQIALCVDKLHFDLCPPKPERIGGKSFCF